MKTIKAEEGTPYEAKKHFNIWGVRKIGVEEGTKRLNVSQSHFLPNGGAEMSSSDKERVYYVLSGSITVKGKAETHVLEPGDMIYIAPGEEREIKVNGNECASTLVIIVEP
jgi:quercetin dioxygenase-like cupin family protein